MESRTRILKDALKSEQENQKEITRKKSFVFSSVHFLYSKLSKLIKLLNFTGLDYLLATINYLTERNYLLKITHENLIQELNHPIDKVCGIYSAVKHAVGMALGSKFGYSGIICIADNFAKRSLGFENEKDVMFSIQNACTEVGCNESWDSVLGKSWDRRPGSYEESDKYIKSMRFYIRKIFSMSFIKCGLVTIEGVYPASSYREVIRHNLKEAQSDYLM